MQKREKASITLSLHQEIEREVQELEKEMAQHPELDKIQVTEEMDRALFEKIRAYEEEKKKGRRDTEDTGEDIREVWDGSTAETDGDGVGRTAEKKADGGFGKFRNGNDSVEFSEELVPDLSEIRRRAVGESRKSVEEETAGKVLYRRKNRKYWLVSLVAVVVIVLGVGVNSVGSKSYWKNLWQAVRGEPVNGIDVEDMDKQNTEDVDEIAVYREIESKFHIKPVRFLYQPDDMKLIDYEIYEEIFTAQLLYKYQDEVIRYILYVNSSDSSWGEKKEDTKIDEYTVSVNGIEIKVDEYEVADSLENRQTANFEYKGVHYQLKGAIKRSEFEIILENLYFL